MHVHIDFETYSGVELQTVGVYNYADSETTGVHCMAWAVDDGEVNLWVEGEPFPKGLAKHLAGNCTIFAHNAQFEWCIWNKVCVRKYQWPPLPLEKLRCTMAMAYAMSLPGTLASVAAAVGAGQEKDAAGARVMMQLAKPNRDGVKWESGFAPEKFKQLYDYCKQDVETERALVPKLLQLSETEQRLWAVDQRINQRGFKIDRRAVEQAIAIIAAEKLKLDKSMLEATDGSVSKCTEVKKLTQWLNDQGVLIDGLAKADLTAMLELDDLPPKIREVLTLRQLAAKTSTAKIVAMRDRACADDRVRGAFQYHGASTGRWAHRGVQPGNLPRPRNGMKPKDIEDIIQNLHQPAYVDAMYGPLMSAMADCVRAMIVAKEGHEFIAMDFSAIEARVLPWLAGQENVLGIFRTHGKIYEHAAAGIYNKKIDAVTPAERMIGKVSVLALGFGGGVGAFQSMARIYGLKIDDEDADKIKVAWREANKHITNYWAALETAAMDAVEFGGVHTAGAKGRKISFKKSGSYLFAKLPSGRMLCYPKPWVATRELPWGQLKPALHFMSVDGLTNKWAPTTTYGGSLAENITQAVARDLLAESILRFEESGYEVVLHCHDEVVIEVPEGSTSLLLAEQIMCVEPDWADGLPIAAEGYIAKRYRK